MKASSLSKWCVGTVSRQETARLFGRVVRSFHDTSAKTEIRFWHQESTNWTCIKGEYHSACRLETMTYAKGTIVTARTAAANMKVQMTPTKENIQLTSNKAAVTMRN